MAAPQRLPTPCQIQWIWASEAPPSPGLRWQKRTVAQSGRIPELAARRRCSVFAGFLPAPETGWKAGDPVVVAWTLTALRIYPTTTLTAAIFQLLLKPLKS